ncbi:hypothetical protein ACHAPT_013588 [Fusarium lateritium]
MRPSNTAKSICGHPISEYLEKEPKVNKVPVFFCAEISVSTWFAMEMPADETARWKALTKTKDKTKASKPTKRATSRAKDTSESKKPSTKTTKPPKRTSSGTRDTSVDSKVQTGRVDKKARKENKV